MGRRGRRARESRVWFYEIAPARACARGNQEKFLKIFSTKEVTSGKRNCKSNQDDDHLRRHKQAGFRSSSKCGNGPLLQLLFGIHICSKGTVGLDFLSI